MMRFHGLSPFLGLKGGAADPAAAPPRLFLTPSPALPTL
jgi:hypothetical protein